MSKLAWIGLGTMGFPMAGHLKTRGGHAVTVFNRTRAKADAWVAKFGGNAAPSPAEAADGADFVFTCVGNDDDLRAVTLGPDGAFQALAARGRSSSTTPRPRPASPASCMTPPESAAPARSMRRSRAANPAPRTARSR